MMDTSISTPAASSATPTTNTCTTATILSDDAKTAAEATEQYVKSLFDEFRELVLGLQEERRDLETKLRDFPLRTNSPSLLLPSAAHRSRLRTLTAGVSTNGSDTATTNTSANRPSSAATTSSPIDDPSLLTNTNTSSSGSASQATGTSSSNTKPPSYKTATHSATLPPAQLPKAPIRTKRLQRINDIIHSNRHRMSAQTTAQMAARGALIVLEGLDRVGKSTLATRLVEHLELIRKPVSFCRFPDRSTPIGLLINEFLQTKSASKRPPVDEHAMHLLFSANRWELSKRIKNTLIQGTTVIVDRYSYSGIAYSSAKSGLSMDWCCEPEKGLPKPDLVIYLELPKEAQYKRPGFGDELFETRELQERVRIQYEHLMEASQDIWLRVDVEDKTPEQVLGEVIVPVKRCLEASAHKQIGELDFL